MTPKSGKAGSAADPLQPQAVVDAASAETGQVSSASARGLEPAPGEYGSTTVASRASGNEDPDQPKVWISIELQDEEGNPIAGEAYEITPPGETSPRKGTLDARGKARLEGIDPGTCQVSFPNIHAPEWTRK